MLPTRQGSIRLFRFAGIDVYLHWSWFLMLIYQLQFRGQRSLSLGWNLLEYLCLFGIVTVHEFGHALACRQVGGRANQIILWPFGGVAFVDPPQRPGPILWSIAAGPLVNVALIPLFGGLILLTGYLGWADAHASFDRFVWDIFAMNLFLLVFNLLPIYPLDGGQILQSLLWFVLGKARALMVTVIIGFIGVALLAILAFFTREAIFWFVVAFILLNCWRGLMQARFLAKLAKLPRRGSFACPSCREAPLIGPLWICPRCLARFDAFENNSFCPNCAEYLASIPCHDCGETYPMPQWRTAGFTPAPPPLPS